MPVQGDDEVRLAAAREAVRHELSKAALLLAIIGAVISPSAGLGSGILRVAKIALADIAVGLYTEVRVADPGRRLAVVVGVLVSAVSIDVVTEPALAVRFTPWLGAMVLGGVAFLAWWGGYRRIRSSGNNGP